MSGVGYGAVVPYGSKNYSFYYKLGGNLNSHNRIVLLLGLFHPQGRPLSVSFLLRASHESHSQAGSTTPNVKKNTNENL